MDLGSFYPPGDPYLAELSTKAAALRLDKNKSLTLNREEDVVDLAKLALYDTVIYCGMMSSLLLIWNPRANNHRRQHLHELWNPHLRTQKPRPARLQNHDHARRHRD